MGVGYVVSNVRDTPTLSHLGLRWERLLLLG